MIDECEAFPSHDGPPKYPLSPIILVTAKTVTRTITPSKRPRLERLIARSNHPSQQYYNSSFDSSLPDLSLYTIMKSLLLLILGTSSQIATVQGYDWACNLYCYNGGECQHGKGKFGSYAGVDDTVALPWEQAAPSQGQAGMFCTCPKGFTGLQCEISLVACGEEHTCFNGSQCKKERSGDGSTYYRCECDAENSVLTAKYAGKYCEHIATTFCSKNGGSSDTYDGQKSFCSNGGKCKTVTDDADTEQ